MVLFVPAIELFLPIMTFATLALGVVVTAVVVLFVVWFLMVVEVALVIADFTAVRLLVVLIAVATLVEATEAVAGFAVVAEEEMVAAQQVEISSAKKRVKVKRGEGGMSVPRGSYELLRIPQRSIYIVLGSSIIWNNSMVGDEFKFYF